MEISSEWTSVIQSIVERPGITVVIGGIDTGKTTFVRELVNAGVAAGVPTAIVDADLGQSEVGPPATISMALVEHPVESLRELRPRRMYFVGTTTPAGQLLAAVAGVKRMADEAVARGAKLVVVDTSGLVTGILGRRLKLHKIELLGPEHIVAIRRKRELDHILAVLRKIECHTLHELQISPEARSKPKEFRAARRRTQFYDYFKGADRHIIRLDDVVCSGTFFTTGRVIRWQHHRVLERTLKTRVLHAEIVGDGMYIVAECRPHMAGLEALRNKYGARDFTIVCGTDFTNVLVGLADDNDNTIDLGIIEAIDFRQRHMAVITPASTVTPVRIVQFGSIRIKQDGNELGSVKPGEI